MQGGCEWKFAMEGSVFADWVTEKVIGDVSSEKYMFASDIRTYLLMQGIQNEAPRFKVYLFLW